MENLLNRHRNAMVLLGVILAQLILLAYQIKSNGEMRLIRVWAIAAVTPLARVIEAARSGTTGLLDHYVMLAGARGESLRMKTELDREKMDNQRLRTELAMADRARALALFEQQAPSKTIAARVIGNATGIGARVVILDRGTSSGIEKGMAVITPEGIAGKITGAYSNASYVLLLTDSSFAAGIISQKHRVRGTLRGQGDAPPIIDLVSNELKVENGEWFFTSGDDRIFPKGLPVGVADVVRAGASRKEIYVTPSGLQNGLEDVLIIVDGVHAQIPEAAPQNQAVHLLPPPPVDAADSVDTMPARSGPLATDADRLVEHYRSLGAAQKHAYGDRGSPAPNYNLNIDETPRKPALVEGRTPPPLP